MKIRLNGSIKLDDDITFDNLDIELFNHSSTDGYPNECIIGDYDELVSLDEYLGEMVGDYADIIMYGGVDLHDALAAMVYELFELWMRIHTDY